MGFTDKVVLITGASSGIGAATAEYLAKLGATLVLVGRNEENLKQTSQKCIANKDIPKPLEIIADVTIETDVNQIIEKTIDHFGKLDILVNNAGIIGFGTLETTTLDEYDKVMDINLRSVVNLTKLAVPHLEKTKGNIVNLSSVAGTRSFASLLAYGISKSAIDQFTKCVALELAPKGIRVNSVNPGVINTELHKRSGFSNEQYADFLERAKLTHPLGRPGEGHEVAAAIAFLGSDLASFITGVQLAVDGGKHIMCPR